MLSAFFIIVVTELDEPGAPSPHAAGGRPGGQWERAGMRSPASCRPKGWQSRACCVSPASPVSCSQNTHFTPSPVHSKLVQVFYPALSHFQQKKNPFLLFKKKKKKGICSELSNLPNTKINLTGSVPSLPFFPS